MLVCVSSFGGIKLPSPKDAAAQVNTPMSKVIIAPRHVFITWTHEWGVPNPRLEYDVEWTDDFVDWVVTDTVKQPPIEIQEGFWRVGVHEIVPIE